MKGEYINLDTAKKIRRYNILLKRLKMYKKENERLNDILNELEELCKTKYYEKNTTNIDSIAIAGNLYVYMYKKIKELRDSDK